MGTSARVVIIGAGVVGASAAQHLAELGEADVLVLDKGPLWAAGGSSSHAPGLVFQTNPSKAMTELAAATVELYRGLELDGLPCFHPVGGIEVAATPERWRELARRHGFARAWGLEAELLSPEEVAKQIPTIEAARILGGLHVAGDGIAKAVRGIEAMARAAQARGVRFQAETEVAGFDVRDGQVHAVETDRGRIDCEVVLCCAGIWGPRIGRLAGVAIPLLPLAHQYVRTTPLAELADAADLEVLQPILRHQDRRMYFRQIGERYGIGSYAHRVMPLAPDAIPSNAEARAGLKGARPAGGAWGGQPSVQRFTEEDFAEQWRDAVELLPGIGATEVEESMNGLFSFTADGNPLLGESRAVRGFWVAEAVWVTHSGGVGREMAQWIVEGRPSLDLREADLNRFEDFQLSPSYVEARSAQNFREVYDIIHPLQPMEEPRPLRTSPFYARQQELGAAFLEYVGWERPHWYEANAGLVAGLDVPGRDEWSARYWSPIAVAEHAATRERVAMFDMSPLKKLEVTGPGALGFLNRLTTNQLDKSVGSVVYTLMLDHTGGIRSDLTIARLGVDRFQVGANGALDVDWMQRQLPADGSVRIADVTGARCCIGLWGPRARRVLEQLTADDVSHRGFGFFRAKEIFVGEIPVTAMRLSYVGELGWELYTSAEHGLRLWDLLWDAGQAHGVVAGGRSAFNALRLEKGYRSWGTDIWTEHTPEEAGLSFAVRMDQGDFIGRDALTRRAPGQRLRCLVLKDPARVVLGKEPVLRSDEPVGFVTSAAYGHAVGESIAYAWLPLDCAEPGARLEISYLGQRLPARVATEPLYDPRMQRMRC